MTVLVLDSPELIARAAALEAAQATEEVKAEGTRVAHTEAEASASAEPAYSARNSTLAEQQEDALALVI